MKISIIEGKATCGKVIEEKIEAISTGRKEAILQGIVNLPNPCYKLLVSYEIVDDILNIRINLEYSGKMCIQCVAVKKFEIRIINIPEKIKVINALYKGKVLLTKSIT